MSHYPTSADLAAFRRSIAGHPDALVDMHPDRYPGFTGAWSDERQHGIGYRISQDDPDLTWCRDECCVWADGDSYVIPRREASAMRSRAYVARGIAVRYCTPYDCAHRTHYRPTIDGQSWS
jgi:hypothetical protein